VPSHQNPAAGQDPIQRRGVGQQLAVDVTLADPAGDQLAVLGAEIEDEDGLSRGGCHLIFDVMIPKGPRQVKDARKI
jgi:hypothetical protein